MRIDSANLIGKETTGVRKEITNISVHGWGGGLLVADGRVYTFNGQEGNTNSTRGFTTGSGNAGAGLTNMRELVFPGESGTVIDANVVGSQAYALFDNGNLWMWGYNGRGALGLGNTNDVYYLPTLSTTNVVKFYYHPSQDGREQFYSHFFILKIDGKVYGTGYNGFGQLGLGDTTQRNAWTEIPAMGTNPISVWALGNYTGNTFVNKSDGSIWACGYNSYGQLGLGNTTSPISTLTNTGTRWNDGDTSKIIRKIAFGAGYSDGTDQNYTNLTMWLKNDTTSLVRSAGSQNWGSLGNNVVASGSLSTPANATGLLTSGEITSIARSGGSPGSVYALKTDGTVWAWGYNGNGTLGRGTTTNSGLPTAMTGATGVTNIFLDNHSWQSYTYQVPSPVFELADGYYRCGHNAYGQCANGTTTDATTLVKMRFPEGIRFKLMGSMNTSTNGPTYYAVDTENQIWCWGYNSQYSIELTTTASFVQPIVINPPCLLR